MDKKLKNSEYVNAERKAYSLYVLTNRAIPAITDGLKPAARRVLWTARDGHKYKSLSLAGATLSIHPHGAPESAINTLAAPYGNNIPLLDGIGTFGTLLSPTGYGASRYTFVKLSEFTKDVVFRDMDIIPMMKNYDETLDEPIHFLPLIPLVLLNPAEGIAVGFSTTILPRSLEDIVEEQLKFLTKKNPTLENKPITFYPTNVKSIDNNDTTWYFKGKCELVGTTNVLVTDLPYGVTHENFTDHLIKLIEKDDRVLDFEDGSKNKISIKIKFARGVLPTLQEDKLYSLLGLNNKIKENINVLDFDGERVWSGDFQSIIAIFTTWRLEWYQVRYERLANLLKEEMQRYLDILLAIKKNVGGLAKTISSKKDLCEQLREIGIINIEYIASLPVSLHTAFRKVIFSASGINLLIIGNSVLLKVPFNPHASTILPSLHHLSQNI